MILILFLLRGSVLMFIDCCSKKDIENEKYTKRLPGRWFVISIYSPDNLPADIAFTDSCAGVLLLCFDDRDYESGDGGRKVELFKKEWADEILSLIDGFGESIDSIIVHCEAGISRSSAIAAGICKYFGKSDNKFFKDKVPNRFVYRLMLNAIDTHIKVLPYSVSIERHKKIMKGNTVV